MIAALFPGQGAEVPEMGLALARRDATAASLLRVAGEAAGVDAVDVLTRGSPALLRTEVAQPLLVAVSLGAFFAGDLAAIGACAGHSLGELAAWSAAGGVDPVDAVRLAAARGRAMARANPKGGMVQVRLSEEALRALLTAEPALALAAHNGPDVWCLSGPTAALRRVRGGAPVPVGGPWHHPMMAAAGEAFREALARVPTRALTRVLVSAHRAAAVASEEVPAGLVAQLTAPVRWVDTLRALADLGVDTFVAVAPGRTLAASVAAVLPDARVRRDPVGAT